MRASPLVEAEIRSSGPIPFRRFMELALYHPEVGYYAKGRDPFGKRGDYYTNGQIQPVFGRLIAAQVARWRAEMGDPGSFRVLEPGAGRAETRDEACRSLPGVVWECLEVGDPWPRRPVTGVVFCNEFFDALPVDVVERSEDGQGWTEWGVGLRDGRLTWVRLGPSHPRPGLPNIGPGRRIETCESQMAAMRKILRTLRRGVVAVVDYGYTRSEIELGGRFTDGSLMAYRRHSADPDVLREPGLRDITAHVNFSALEDAARAHGARVRAFCSQQAFLLDAGRHDSFESALAAPSEKRRLELRMQLKTLLFGLGETFRVLLLDMP